MEKKYPILIQYANCVCLKRYNERIWIFPDEFGVKVSLFRVLDKDVDISTHVNNDNRRIFKRCGIAVSVTILVLSKQRATDIAQAFFLYQKHFIDNSLKNQTI